MKHINYFRKHFSIYHAFSKS